MTTTLRLSGLLLAGACLFSAEKGTVTMYMYSEYIDPAIAEQFLKDTGYKLDVQVYESQDEMVSKLRAGAGNQYDVLIGTDVIVTKMIKLGLVKPLDQGLIPKAVGVDEKFRNPPFDPNNQYSWPYLWGTIGIAYDTTKAPKTPATWAWLLDEKQQFGSFVFMDEQRSMLGTVLVSQGKSINSRDPAEIKAAADALIAAKKTKNCVGFDGGVGGLAKVSGGEAAAAVVYNGDAARAIADKPTIGYAVPKEGGNLWVDVMLISAQAPNSDGAHALINYLLDPKIAAQNTNVMKYANGVASATPLVEEAIRTNVVIYPDAETMKTLQVMGDVGKENRLYDEAWTAVKAQ